jgi:hypothetical protein
MAFIALSMKLFDQTKAHEPQTFHLLRPEDRSGGQHQRHASLLPSFNSGGEGAALPLSGHGKGSFKRPHFSPYRRVNACLVKKFQQKTRLSPGFFR